MFYLSFLCLFSPFAFSSYRQKFHYSYSFYLSTALMIWRYVYRRNTLSRLLRVVFHLHELYKVNVTIIFSVNSWTHFQKPSLREYWHKMLGALSSNWTLAFSIGLPFSKRTVMSSFTLTSLFRKSRSWNLKTNAGRLNNMKLSIFNFLTEGKGFN